MNRERLYAFWCPACEMKSLFTETTMQDYSQTLFHDWRTMKNSISAYLGDANHAEKLLREARTRIKELDAELAALKKVNARSSKGRVDVTVTIEGMTEAARLTPDQAEQLAAELIEMAQQARGG